MAQRARDRLSRSLLFAPAVFVAHFLEESPGSVPWFNGHVTRAITQDLFWTVNAMALLITVLLTLGYWATRSDSALLLMVAWLSFLMLTNAIFHITAALLDRGARRDSDGCAWIPGPVPRDPPLLGAA